MGKLNPKVNPDTILDRNKSKVEFKKALKPLLLDVLGNAIEDGNNLVKPTTPHKQAEPISGDALKWLDTRIGWAAEEVGETTATMLSKAIKAGFAEGESMEDIAKRVKDVFGICNDSRALKIARTEVIMASNEGALFGYAESGVVEKAEFYAALDERVCEDCSDLHGMVRDLADSHGIIPVHPECRCVMLPVV